MPKLKTNRGAAKRFIRTGKGQLKRARANHNHILTKKSIQRKRRLRKLTVVSKPDFQAINDLLRA